MSSQDSNTKSPFETLDGVATIDVDNDGLDDRLYTGPSTTNSIQDVLNRIGQLNIENLPEEPLFRMLDNMRSERDALINIAREKEKQVHADLLKGKYHIVAKTRKSYVCSKRRKCHLGYSAHTRKPNSGEATACLNGCTHWEQWDR